MFAQALDVHNDAAQGISVGGNKDVVSRAKRWDQGSLEVGDGALGGEFQ